MPCTHHVMRLGVRWMLQTGFVRAGLRARLADFANRPIVPAMTTMNISLPDALRDFVDEQVANRGFATSSEYVRELIRRDQERLRLRELLIEGASSRPTTPVDEGYFDRLRARARHRQPG